LPSDFTVLIDGKDVPLRRVQRDTQLSLYLPPDRFVLLSDLAKEAEAIDFYQEVEPVMPSTGSSTPLLGLLGLLACGLGLLMTSLRRFRRS
jgi:LPXTG-motif cell wall-anchored protein